MFFCHPFCLFFCISFFILFLYFVRILSDKTLRQQLQQFLPAQRSQRERLALNDLACEILFLLLKSEDALLNRILHNQLEYRYLFLLPDSMCAVGRLILSCDILPRVVGDYAICRSQVQSRATCLQ